MRRVTWAPRAKADLARIDVFYAERDPDFADEIGQAAIAAGRFLSEFPAAGPIVDRDARKWRIAETDFLLLYRITLTGVEILRVRHGREDWQRAAP